jgi:hypothetical protein
LRFLRIEHGRAQQHNEGSEEYRVPNGRAISYIEWNFHERTILLEARR